MPTCRQITEAIKNRIAQLDNMVAQAVRDAAIEAVEECFTSANVWEPHYDRARAGRRQRAWLVRNKETSKFHLAKNGRPMVYEFEHSAISVARRLNAEN
jgi:hypothetical protein